MIRKKLPISPYLIAFIVPWVAYFTQIWVSAIQVRSDGWYAAYLPHWGDGVAHLSYMAAFAFRSVFPVTHPLFYGHPFTYSFFADAIGGLITRIGVPQWLSYNLLGLILSIACLFGLWHLFRLLTHSDKQSLLAGNLFLLSGGLGWKYLILDRLGITTPPVVSYFPLLYTQREGTDIVWLNTIIGELIPQRAFLLAIPLGIFLLLTWYKRFILGKAVSRKRLILTGIIFGLMPIIHPHTTMILALTFLCWCLPTIKKNIKDIVLIGLPTLVIGGAMVARFLIPSVSSGFFKFFPGWLSGPKDTNWFIFWMDNWGIFLPLAAIGSFFFLDKTLKKVILPFWIWFLLANLFLFQPYDWDNAKLLTWVNLFLCIPVVRVMAKLWRANRINKSLVIISILFMTLAGGLDALHMVDTNTYRIKIVSDEEISLANQVKQLTPTDAVILTATTHRNWVPILTGRQILCGYQGWMWTYGIKAGSRVDDMKAIYAGESNAAELLRKYHVGYIVVGPEERDEFSVNDPYMSQYPVLIQTVSTTVYQVTPR